MPNVQDDPRLRRFLEAQGLSGTFEAQRIGEGQSCLTFLLRGDDWRVVLRRPPRGEHHRTAHDVRREHRVLRSLADAGMPVPVPPPLALCEDLDVLGVPFYLMEVVDGVVVQPEVPAPLSSVEEHRRIADAFIDTLVALHGLDHRELGLDGFGRPEGYLERQLARTQERWASERFRDIPYMDEVGKWLADNLPTTPRPALVHGDYRLDNVLYAPEPPARLLAVIDWELSTIGDPLVDLGWTVFFWEEDGERAGALTVTPTVSHLPGFPSRREVVASYLAGTGLDDAEVRWYVALTGWKLAVMMEASYRRHLDGNADHPQYADLEWRIPGLVEQSARAMRGELLI
jgi:aminoglycoside phosphotransferase (APT) family kinase protein